MIAVFKREFKSFFSNMTGYVAIAGTLLLVAIYFYSTNLTQGMSQFEYALVDASTFVFPIVIPILTMKSFAEERKYKSDQLLLTSPLSVSQIVMGKYFGVLAVFGVAVLTLVPYPFILNIMGNVNLATAFSGLVGYFFLCAALSAIGIFASSLTDNQIIAAVITMCSTLFLSMIPSLAETISPLAIVNYGILTALAIAVTFVLYALTKNFYVAFVFAALSEGVLIYLYRAQPTVLEGSVAKILGYAALFRRMDDMVYGIFDVTAIVYYVSIAALFLFFTVQVIEKRRWN
jgi:ABC-2 type transport system permease protein